MPYNVPPRVRTLTGLDVTEVNITVKDSSSRGQEQQG
jgi:uncharacterized alkaline shock family protein YloU